MESIYKSGVVLEPDYQDAFLALAIQEKLINVTDDEATDNVFKRFETMCIKDSVKIAIYENIILGGSVYVVDQGLTDYLDGPLLERGCVKFINNRNNDHNDDNAVSFDIISRRLRLRGVTDTHEQIMNKFMEAILLEEQVERELGELPMITGDGEIFKDVIQKMVEGGGSFYSDVQRLSVKKYYDAKKRLSVIINELHIILNIISASIENNTHIQLAMEGADHLDVESVSSYLSWQKPKIAIADDLLGADRSKLFRITCSKLNRVPVFPTLKENIECAISSRASDMRYAVNRWFDDISTNGISGCERTLKELERGLAYQKGYGLTPALGQFCTYASVPLACLGASSEILTSIGIAISLTGGLALVKSESDRNKYAWTMFD